MKWALQSAIALLLCSSLLQARGSASLQPTPTRCDPDSLPPPTPLELASDPHGVDFGPYLKGVLPAIKRHWYSRIPDEAREPLMKKGCVIIEFAILKEGKLDEVRISAASGDSQLDDAALQAIALSSPFPPLPVESKESVKVRFQFYYNPSSSTFRKRSSSTTNLSPSPAAMANSAVPTEESGRSPTLTINGPPLRPLVTTDIVSLGGASPRGLYTPLPSFAPRVDPSAQHGVVLLSLVVTKKGKAHHVRVLEGLNHDLDRAARKTIETWKFEPPTRDGKAIEVPLNVKVTFNLE